MIQTSGSAVNILTEDDFGITYYIENAQQFWSGTFRHTFHTLQLLVRQKKLTILYCGPSNLTPEIDDILRLPSDGSATLSVLDTALRRFVYLCASYHG